MITIDRLYKVNVNVVFLGRELSDPWDPSLWKSETVGWWHRSEAGGKGTKNKAFLFCLKWRTFIENLNIGTHVANVKQPFVRVSSPRSTTLTQRWSKGQKGIGSTGSVGFMNDDGTWVLVRKVTWNASKYKLQEAKRKNEGGSEKWNVAYVYAANNYIYI